MKTIEIPYYTSKVQLHIEEKNLKAVIQAKLHEFHPEKSETEIVREAMNHPIGTLRLEELAKGKNDINRCPYETVARLAAYFRCDPSDLANPIQYVANIHGVYRKVPYHWIIKEDVAELHIRDNQSDIVLLRDSKMTQARFSKEYYATTLCYIDIHLRDKEVKRLLCQSEDTP